MIPRIFFLAPALVMIFLVGCSTVEVVELTPEQAYSRCIMNRTREWEDNFYRRVGSGEFVRWKYRICVETGSCTLVDSYEFVPGGVRFGRHTLLGTMDIIELEPGEKRISDYCSVQ